MISIGWLLKEQRRCERLLNHSGTEVCCSLHQSSCLFCSASLKTKSTCLALFSALAIYSVQCCASIVYLLIRLGSQPLPRRNRTKLDVSVSPVGFFQKMSSISFGHDFNGKKASPSISLAKCLLSSTTSALDIRPIFPRYRLNVAIMLFFLKSALRNLQSC